MRRGERPAKRAKKSHLSPDTVFFNPKSNVSLNRSPETKRRETALAYGRSQESTEGLVVDTGRNMPKATPNRGRKEALVSSVSYSATPDASGTDRLLSPTAGVGSYPLQRG